MTALGLERWSGGGLREGSRGRGSIPTLSYSVQLLSHSDSSTLVWTPMFLLEARDSLQSGKAPVSTSLSNSLSIPSFLYSAGSFDFSFSRIYTLVPPLVVKRAEWAVFTATAGRKRRRRSGRRKKRNRR